VKWARRFRARLRAALRAARGAWQAKGQAPGLSILNVYVGVSTELLDSGDPNVPYLVACDAYDRALDATKRRMEFA